MSSFSLLRRSSSILRSPLFSFWSNARYDNPFHRSETGQRGPRPPWVFRLLFGGLSHRPEAKFSRIFLLRLGEVGSSLSRSSGTPPRARSVGERDRRLGSLHIEGQPGFKRLSASAAQPPRASGLTKGCHLIFNGLVVPQNIRFEQELVAVGEVQFTRSISRTGVKKREHARKQRPQRTLWWK